MARKAVATEESVAWAVEALVDEKLEPTVERVRSKLGGGSFTTINRVLAAVLVQRQTQATQTSEVPADLAEIGQRAVGAIYAAVQRQAASKIELIETDCRKQIDAANHARAEAALEIERLEREVEHGTETLTTAQRTTQEALARAERAEATSQASQAEIQRLERAITNAQADATRLRQEQGQLQTQLAKAEAGIDATRAELQKSTKNLDRAQEGERRARDEAAELRGQIKAADAKNRN